MDGTLIVFAVTAVASFYPIYRIADWIGRKRLTQLPSAAASMAGTGVTARKARGAFLQALRLEVLARVDEALVAIRSAVAREHSGTEGAEHALDEFQRLQATREMMSTLFHPDAAAAYEDLLAAARRTISHADAGTLAQMDAAHARLVAVIRDRPRRKMNATYPAAPSAGPFASLANALGLRGVSARSAAAKRPA